MKKLVCSLLVIALSAMAVDAAGDNVPPGLQKKGGVPPGQAKKRKGGVQESVAEKSNTVSAVTNAVPTASNVPAAPAVPTPPPTPAKSLKAIKADLDKRATAVNTLDDKPSVRRAGFAAIQRETGASPKLLEEQRIGFSGIGTAGLLIAHEMAAQTKKHSSNFLRERQQGTTWDDIAAKHKVDLGTIDAKLSRVEEAMRKAK